MNNIYTAEQVKTFETNIFVSKGDDLRAMQEAAKQSVKVLIKDYSKADYLVLCGPGNNGGDGYFIGLGLSESNKCVKFINVLEDSKKSPLGYYAFKKVKNQKLVDLKQLKNISKKIC